MESIKRMVMLLKPWSPALAGGGGTLKLQSFKEGVSVYLRCDSLCEGSYRLYLFISGGRDLKEYFAGEIKGSEFYSTLYSVPIDSIKGAAVINIEENGAYNFILRSNGPDWPKIIERFRITSSKKEPHIFSSHVSESHKDIPEADKKTEPDEIGKDESIYDESKSIKKTEPDEIKKDESIPDESESIQAPENNENINTEETLITEKTEGIEENGCKACPFTENRENIDPFPDIFPDSEWVKISYPGPSGLWHYLSGKIFKNGAVAAMAIGVPGEYGITPPVWLEGFNTYLRTPSGGANGYWLMFQDAETGEALDMGLSLHDA